MISMYICNNYIIIMKYWSVLDMCNVFCSREYFKFPKYVCILFDLWYILMFCKYAKCMYFLGMLSIYWGVLKYILIEVCSLCELYYMLLIWFVFIYWNEVRCNNFICVWCLITFIFTNNVVMWNFGWIV